ncbi:DUF268 domain-containing protein [Gymnodinialimonas sp.]
MFGFDARKMGKSIAALPRFYSDYKHLKTALAEQDGGLEIERFYPVLMESAEPSGEATGHYFHQDLLVAQKVFASDAARVVDIGSRVDGFVAHVAAFRKIEVVDFRALESGHDNIAFLQCDVMEEGATSQLGESDLVTCLHVLEHFGLGRYGDPIAADGHLRGLRNLERMVADGGRLILSVPIGRERIEFNAHRIFASGTMPSLISDAFTLTDFSYVDDRGDLHTSVDLVAQKDKLDAMHFGCGIYDFRKA